MVRARPGEPMTISRFLLTLVVLLSIAPAARGQAGPTAAVFELQPESGVSLGVARLVTESLTAEVRRVGSFSRVISSSEIEGIIGVERQKQMMGCDQQSCIAELAGALGADYLFIGNLGKLGNSYLVNIKLVRSNQGMLVSGVSRRVQGETDEALLDAVIPAVDELLGNAKLVRDGVTLHTEPAPSSARPASRDSGPAGGTRIAVGTAGLGAGLVTLVLTVAVTLAAVSVVVIPYFVMRVPTPGASPEMRRFVFPATATATAVVAALLGVAGLALVIGGAAGVASGVLGG